MLASTYCTVVFMKFCHSHGTGSHLNRAPRPCHPQLLAPGKAAVAGGTTSLCARAYASSATGPRRPRNLSCVASPSEIVQMGRTRSTQYQCLDTPPRWSFEESLEILHAPVASGKPPLDRPSQPPFEPDIRPDSQACQQDGPAPRLCQPLAPPTHTHIKFHHNCWPAESRLLPGRVGALPAGGVRQPQPSSLRDLSRS